MKEPTVAIVDPLWIGHHPMYFGEFGASFLRNGAQVVGICPQPDAGRGEILQAYGDPDAPVDCLPLQTGGRSVLGGRFEGDPWRTFQRWRFAADAIHSAEKQSGKPFDLIYFPYLDSYLRFLPFPRVPEATIARPWSGLYLRNHHYRNGGSLLQTARIFAKGDHLLSSPSCRGIGVLDERYGEALEMQTGQQVTAFPDVTLTDLPESPSAFAKEIARKAKGRKVIGLIGLEKRKGALTMLRLARQCQSEETPWFFVFAGTYDASEFSPSEQEEFASIDRNIRSGQVDHVHFDPAATRIPTEPEFNSLFSSFDLAWAAYLDFAGSSGTLSKAAAFETPVIATEGECIGERVHRFRLGRTIPQDDVEAAKAAINELFSRPHDPDYAGYRSKHSRSRLDHCIAGLLARL